jgi:hypothetical protein
MSVEEITFCPDESYNILCQTKTAARLKEEFKYYQGISRDLRNFFILDSDALKDPKVIIEISKYLDGKKFSFIYAEFRAEKMDKDVLGAILRFGTWASNFQIGIETFSDRLLQLMNKGGHNAKECRGLKDCGRTRGTRTVQPLHVLSLMTESDMNENLRVMDLITHILVSKNIQIFPGEFYLPTDCPVYLNNDSYGIKKNSESIFSLIFEDFNMPSYSNYPYPYQFDNDDEQYRISGMLRKKVEDIKNKNPQDNYMFYKDSSNGMEIEISRDGQRTTSTLSREEKEILSQQLKNFSK